MGSEPPSILLGFTGNQATMGVRNDKYTRRSPEPVLLTAQDSSPGMLVRARSFLSIQSKTDLKDDSGISFSKQNASDAFKESQRTS